jgi:hypothetical protein
MLVLSGKIGEAVVVGALTGSYTSSKSWSSRFGGQTCGWASRSMPPSPSTARRCGNVSAPAGERPQPAGEQ